MRLKLWLCALIATFCVAPGVHAQQGRYPVKSVRLIIPFPPGGSTDIVGRVVAQKLSEAWGQQVIVDNRGGAGGQIGVELAQKSPADGYTLVVGHIGTFGVNPSLYPKLRYDAQKDFQPISLVARVHNMLAVHPSLPARSVKDVIALARSKPGVLNYGSSGSGSNPFLSVEFFKLLTKTDITHVPDLPTIGETVPGYEVVQWYGVLAPAGVPREIVNRVNADIVAFLEKPDTAQKMAGEGAIPSGSTPEQFGELIRSEIVRWAKVVQATGAKPE